MAEQPSRSASETEPVIAWLGASFDVARLFDELTLRMVGIWPAKVPELASIMPSGVA